MRPEQTTAERMASRIRIAELVVPEASTLGDLMGFSPELLATSFSLLPLLERIMESGSEEAVGGALRLLSHLGEPAGTPLARELLQRAKKGLYDNSPRSVQGAIFRTFGAFPSLAGRSAPFLFRVMQRARGEDAEEQREFNSPSYQATTALLELRSEIPEALWKRVRTLLVRLREKDSMGRVDAAHLARIPELYTEPRFCRWIQEQGEHYAEVEMAFLAHLPREEARAAFAKAIKSTPGRLTIFLDVAAKRGDSPFSREELTKFLGSRNSEVRLAAIRLLSRLEGGGVGSGKVEEERKESPSAASIPRERKR